MLGLAVELAGFPLDEGLDLRGEARSQSCGSTLALGFELGPDGLTKRLGLQVTACAIGQASAAIFARHANGLDAQAIDHSLEDVDAWLGGGTAPNWPDIEAISNARDYSARHGAILLPWRAAQQALSKAGAER
ncbi:iron-sulfur cluster assembly scaffold protein [Erythrobacter jejuensis]|uniref:Iron-sulfur cluster assembly scaffold protein n=1 Tax=Parerythrobacter jejuensis TaxID=795812 RepID=A0A845AS96_9SPHN|nr:iron-sulfur cluster assembly scaffold protein [Parerythrobacter jejuensis]